MWRVHVGLTDVETVFRCLKPELGLRTLFATQRRVATPC